MYIRAKILFALILAIKNALKQENLNPEIEEKLLNLQRYQERQMKQEPAADIPSTNLTPRVCRTSTSSNRIYSNKRPVTTVQKFDDTEWQVETSRRKPIKIDVKKEEIR